MNEKTKTKKPTKRQLKALFFIHDVLGLEFPGDINNIYEVSVWLKWYLAKAKFAERNTTLSYNYIADYSDAVGCEV